MCAALVQTVRELLKRNAVEEIRSVVASEGTAPAQVLAGSMLAVVRAGHASAISDLIANACYRHPFSGILLLTRSEAEAARRELDDAIASARAAAIAPDQTGLAAGHAEAVLARHLLSADRVDEARITLETALTTHPESAPNHLLLADARERLGDFAAASSAAVAHARLTGAAPSWRRGIRLLLRAGQPQEAVRLAAKAVDAGIATTAVALEWAGALHGCDRWAEAAAVAASGIAADPAAFPLHRQNIVSLIAAGQTDAACSAALQMLRSVEVTEGAIFVLGTVLKALPDSAARASFVQAAVAANPHPRLGGLKVTASSKSVAKAPSRVSRTDYATERFAPDDSLLELDALFCGMNLPFVRQLAHHAERRRAGKSHAQAVNSYTLRDIKLHVQKGLVTVIDLNGRVMDVFFAPPSEELVQTAQAASAGTSLDSVFILNPQGVRNYSLWSLDALPQIAAAKEFFPKAKVMVPDFPELKYVTQSLAQFGLQDFAPQRLANGTYHLRELNLLNASLAGSARKGMQGGNRSYGRHLLRSLPQASGTATRRIFVDRPPPLRRTAINRRELLELLAGYGFESIDAGSMSVEQQAHTFASATHVVGLHGAALANIIFCRSGTPVLEIHSPDHATSTFAIASIVRDCPYRAVTGVTAAAGGGLWAPPQEVDFLVDLRTLEAELCHMLR